MYAAFRSHCLLDYGEYEVLFGVSDPTDPALALVSKLQEEFPNVQLRIVHCPQPLGLNGKVSNLAQMLPQARYEHVLINDSDILVAPDYLRRVMAPFADSTVGMTTTLYRGLAGTTLASKLEALGISTDFMGGVLVAREMEGGSASGSAQLSQRPKQSCARSAASSRWSIIWVTTTNWARAPQRRATTSSCPMRWSRPPCQITASAISGCTSCAGPAM